MSDLASLRAKIIEKLRLISPNGLQILAEEIALVRDPARYRDLYGRGRNREGQPVAGWPDAGVVRASDSTIDAVEATRDRDGWRVHIAADLTKASAATYPNLNGFLFVAGYPDPEPSYDEIMRAQSGFIKLGIPDDRVHLLVGNGLVRELADPRYARVLSTILGIAREPKHFRLLTRGVAAGVPAFQFDPDDDEYGREGGVYRPALADAVELQLRDRGCALVLGRGAAGKTVLGRLIAAGRELRALPSWYSDAKQVQEIAELTRGAILEAIVDFGGDGVLFIVDNAHLSEDLANSIYHQWCEVGRPVGTELLLLGRETWRRGRRPFQETDLDPVFLRAQADEVLGVYRRIVKRALKSAAPVDPPRSVIIEWTRTFGRAKNDDQYSVDLISFSSAVWRKMRDLSVGRWALSEADAAAEVWERYLLNLSYGERRNLVRLASLPDDCPLPLEALVDRYQALSKSVENGIVFETSHGPANAIRYTLVHAALGDSSGSPPHHGQLTRSKSAVKWHASPHSADSILLGGRGATVTWT